MPFTYVALILPGYFAKSEFNVNANGTLENGRDEHLVTLEPWPLRKLSQAPRVKRVRGCLFRGGGGFLR